MLIEPREAFDLNEEAEVGVAGGVQWWDPQLYRSYVKWCHLLGKGMVVAKVVAVKVRDRERMQNLYVSD